MYNGREKIALARTLAIVLDCLSNVLHSLNFSYINAFDPLLDLRSINQVEWESELYIHVLYYIYVFVRNKKSPRLHWRTKYVVLG